MFGTAATLSLVLFANQTATMILSPILVAVAMDFDVATSTAGQLRTIAGAVAGSPRRRRDRSPGGWG